MTDNKLFDKFQKHLNTDKNKPRESIDREQSSLNPVDKKTLLNTLGFDDASWEKNKDMLGYKDGEKYEDFFYRIQGYEVHEFNDYKKKENEPIYFYLGRLESEIKALKIINGKLNLKVTQLEIKNENMENELTKKVKDYKKQSSFIL